MKGQLPAIGATVLVLLLLASFAFDFNDLAHGGAIDLRNRITGARLLEHGINPYFYKWDISQPEDYADPYNNPLLKVSKTTATPTLLLLHLPLAALPYRLGEIGWLLCQWALLLGTAWLWFRLCETPRQRWLLAIFVAGFTCTDAWRLHAERGQAYVLLAFLLAIWLTLTRDAKWGDHFATGLVAGLLATLRPPFLLLIPFLALHRRGQLIGAAVGAILGAGLPLLFNASCWSDYFSAMQLHSYYYRNGIDPAPGQQEYPPTVEGIPTDVLGHYDPIPYADFSLHALLRDLGAAPFPAEPVVLAIAVPFGLWLWLSRGASAERLLPGVAAWMFLADFFLPAYRNNYVDVLGLNLFAFALLAGPRLPAAVWPFFAAVPIGWAVFFLGWNEPATPAWLINLPTLLFTAGAILLLFLSTTGANPGMVSGTRWKRR